MHTDDLSLKPCILSLSRGPMSLPTYLEALNNWSAFLDWQEPVVWLRVFDHAALHAGSDREATLAGKAWMARYKDAISRYVQGIIFLVPEVDYPKLSKMNMQKAFGAKGLVCADIEDAFTWINENTPEPGPFLEQADAIVARVRSAGFPSRQPV
ncbi:hypothetical protein [Taibaiella chishuiensis]|uniref:SpoIIAA-like protein n=1 Tax=Taibaiella chishuiensis TaxID=1434707 RepID=A0A2P8D646_9BACT|nr:hypothetical protein [Taibaiella chishuiensis]PSK92678.1 hypothetical protein B0I18_103256 [Taibaiella chishuiensis]